MDQNPYQSPREPAAESLGEPSPDDIRAARLAILSIWCVTLILMFVPILILLFATSPDTHR